MIESKDISVIVQGSLKNTNIVENIKSIRKYLPKSEIILSTWENEKVKGLDYDILVINKDPGCCIYDYQFYIRNNGNRQLFSTQNGLKKVNRKYTLKLRTDLLLKNKRFLYFWDKYQSINNEYKLFKHKILISTIYARELSDETQLPTPFHPSDFWFFGLTEDLKDYFLETRLMTREELGNYKYKYPNKRPYSSPLWRYPPEQYFFVEFLKRKLEKNINFDDLTDWNEENIFFSKQLIYNNFIFLGVKQSGIISLKKHNFMMRHENLIPGLISFEKFNRRYSEYCKNELYSEKKDIEEEKKKFYCWRLFCRVRLIGSFFLDIGRVIKYKIKGLE